MCGEARIPKLLQGHGDLDPIRGLGSVKGDIRAAHIVRDGMCQIVLGGNSCEGRKSNL